MDVIGCAVEAVRDVFAGFEVAETAFDDNEAAAGVAAVLRAIGLHDVGAIGIAGRVGLLADVVRGQVMQHEAGN
jgi:hypothetical protein